MRPSASASHSPCCWSSRLYLLALELFGPQAAWLACVLALVNPIIGYVVVNVLSESTFLLWWTFGLWGAVRFLREGRFVWLPLAIGFGALAYLTRPEGLLLPAGDRPDARSSCRSCRRPGSTGPDGGAPWRSSRSGSCSWRAPTSRSRADWARSRGSPASWDWPPGPIRWAWSASDRSPPVRRPPTPTGSPLVRMTRAFDESVTPPLFAVALFGAALSLYQRTRLRAWLFLSILLAISAVGLVRLHATGGYLTVRHGLIPGMILTMAAAHGLAWLMARVTIPGRWLGWPHERLRPGPAVWAALLAGFVIYPNLHGLGPRNAGPVFGVCRHRTLDRRSRR